MKKTKSSIPSLSAAAAAAILSLLILGLATTGWSEEKKPKPEKAAAAAKKKPTGADLYAIHCNRCHPERYPTEWNPAQWKTIMLHMRVRANLPAAQAKAILKYLQEDAGS
jgi:mono/diheme cytochrome c family protein